MAAWLSKTDLCRRGWTLEAVARWLGPPERREMSRRTGVERHLYGRDRVELAETDPSFVAWQEAHTLRREARRQAIERAAERRISWARAWSPRILRLPLNQLEAMAIATYNRRLEDRAWRVFERGGEVEDLPSAADSSCPRPFLERIMGCAPSCGTVCSTRSRRPILSWRPKWSASGRSGRSPCQRPWPA